MKLLAVLCLATLAAAASGQSIAECLENDSIACLQKTIYRKAKELFTTGDIELASGVSIVKAAGSGGRAAKTGKELLYEQEINGAAGIAERQDAIQNYVTEEARNFLSSRSLKLNLAKIAESARDLTPSVPEDIQQAVDGVFEGRGSKKSIKHLLPILLAAKAKFGVLSTLGYFAIAFLAKKAIVLSLLSFALSAFVGLKALWAGKGGGVETHVEHVAPPVYYQGWHGGKNAGWNGAAGATAGGWYQPGPVVEHDEALAHGAAYSAYHR